MIDKQLIRESVTAMLTPMHDKKLLEKQKALSDLIKKNAADEAIEKASAAVNDVSSVYQYDNWLARAANSMSKQVTIATHISKGIHSMSQGDSVRFVNDDARPKYLAGSHNIESDLLDISGSASALPIYNFINLVIADGITIKNLIESDSEALIEALSDDREIAESHLNAFKSLLTRTVENPVTSEVNKQLMFPLNGDSLEIVDINDFNYENVIPLYPSVLCHETRAKINKIRFADKKTEAAQDEAEVEKDSFLKIKDLASIRLGGTKPWNISKVVSMSAGEALLLPSLPPVSKKADGFTLSKNIASIFNGAAFKYATKNPINHFIACSIKLESQSNYQNKTDKKNALDLLLVTIFDIAVELRSKKAGWLNDYVININEKFWLDPNRGNLEGQGVYAKKRESTDWQGKVVDAMSHFINDALKEASEQHASSFDANNFNELRKQVLIVANDYKQKSVEVFL